MTKYENHNTSENNAGENSLLTGINQPTSHPSSSLRARHFRFQALPYTYAPFITVASHVGPVTYTIAATAESNASQLIGIVRYLRSDNEEVETEFFDQITINTANVVANVLASFKTTGPLGSQVRVVVEP